MRKGIILFFLCAVFPILLNAGNISFNFYKESLESGKLEKTGGFLYMKVGSGTLDNVFYLHITYPVNQIIEFTKKETNIYYPDDKKAVILVNKDAISTGNFMDPAAKKMDLKALGFKLMELKKSKSGTKELWVPGNIAGSPIKSIMIEKNAENRLLNMEMRAKNGSIMTRFEYADYTKIGDKKLPLFIKTYSGGEKDSYQEIIRLSAVKEDVKLPPIIQNFAIPGGTDLKKVQF